MTGLGCFHTFLDQIPTHLARFVDFLPLLDAQVAVNLWALASVELENGGQNYTAHI